MNLFNKLKKIKFRIDRVKRTDCFLNSNERFWHKGRSLRYLEPPLVNASLMNGFKEKGAALLTVVILVLILTILSTVILSLLSNQTKLIEHDISRVKAKYANEATMVRELERIRKSLSIETTHNVPGRYDNNSMFWAVIIANSSSVFPSVSEMNFSVDYNTTLP